MRYGGNTACVELRSDGGAVLILDAGTGIRRLGESLDGDEPVHVLLSHLHADHILGLGFFAPLFEPGREVHIWGPASTMLDLRQRLTRYLSPPLFPVNLRELPSRLTLHDTPLGNFEIDGLKVTADLVCHPGPTVGYRISEADRTFAYLPDHEPALGVARFPQSGAWTSGYALARGADLLVHDFQYTPAEYTARVGWGHSSIPQALAFAGLAGVKRLVSFHHDPAHSDALLDELHRAVTDASDLGFDLVAGTEGLSLQV